MDEKWLQDIHDKMSDFRTDEPDGLWTGIMQARGKAKHSSGWLWAPAFAALAAAAIFAWVRFDTGGSSDTIVSPVAVAIESPAPQLHEVFLTEARAIHSIKRQKPDSGTAAPQQEDIHFRSDNTIQTPEDKSEDNAIPKEDLRINAYENGYFTQTEAVSGTVKRFAVGINATGGTGASYNATNPGGGMTGGLGPDNAYWEDSPALGIAVYNQGRETRTDMRHYLPMRLGIDIAYMIDNKWSIESGITYTRLHSQLREGSSSHYTDMAQTLHYVGIPLNLTCTVATSKRFELYGSVGGSMEKCIKGIQTTGYILNGTSHGTSSDSIGDRPLQWSVGAAAGVKYLITPWLGAYIEPGIRYYFDDGSSLDTIYKERPLNFDLTFGLRFSF